MNFLFALGYFAALAGVFLWKLVSIWNTAIPGGLQDTRLFLWNAWWFHHAVSVLHTNPFHTTMLFHPFGTQLLSHDFPLWMNLVTFVGQRSGLTLVASSNLWFAFSWILAGFCTYGLAREVTGEAGAAIVAGTFVMTHSYTLARAMQNWGQFNVYGIALFLWFLVRARRTNDWKWFVLAGIALAWTAACHYYFLMYSALIGLTLAVIDLPPLTLTWNGIRGRCCLFALFSKRQQGNNVPRCFGVYFLGLAILAGGIALWISFHPGIYHVGGIKISMQTPENPLFVMWILGMAWAAAHFRIQTIRRVLDPEGQRRRLFQYLLLAAIAGVLLSPLIWESIQLVRAGGYPKQSILWKTHNSGANLFSLFMPNPLHALWGSAVSLWFATRGMNPQEQAASIGWACMALVVWTGLWQFGSKERRWLGLALAATVLAMGTHLHLAQYNLWCPLPFFGFRLLPILGNVRVPERWMAVGAIAWSVVLALAITKLAVKRGWSVKKISACVLVLILVENWPGIPFQTIPSISPVYEHLRQLPPGGILTVPLYIGDSSIGTGDAVPSQFIFPWDHLWAQITHQKPILGGYVGRISRHLIDDYKADPFIHRLLDLEEHKIQTQDPEPAFGQYAVTNLNFSYVLAYPESTTPEALKYVLESLPLKLITQDSSIRLYEVQR